jgi:trypsin
MMKVNRFRTWVAGFALLASSNRCSKIEQNQSSPKIIGGTVVSHSPGFVSLVEKDSDSPFCGGTIIAPDAILTAAHCVSGWDVSGLQVVVNPLTLADVKAKNKVNIQAVWVHSEYIKDDRNDIAILMVDPKELSKENPNIIPLRSVSLEEKFLSFIQTEGFGNATSQGWVGPNKRREVSVPVLTKETCQSYAAEFPNSGYDRIDERAICAGLPRGGADSCQGDSGGPAYELDAVSGEKTLVGVVSWGNGCAQGFGPGVYTNVAHFYEWIQNSLQEHRTKAWTDLPIQDVFSRYCFAGDLKHENSLSQGNATFSLIHKTQPAGPFTEITLDEAQLENSKHKACIVPFDSGAYTFMAPIHANKIIAVKVYQDTDGTKVSKYFAAPAKSNGSLSLACSEGGKSISASGRFFNQEEETPWPKTAEQLSFQIQWNGTYLYESDLTENERKSLDLSTFVPAQTCEAGEQQFKLYKQPGLPQGVGYYKLEVSNWNGQYSRSVYLGSSTVSSQPLPQTTDKIDAQFKVNQLGESFLHIQNVSGSHLFGIWMECDGDFTLTDQNSREITPEKLESGPFVFDQLDPTSPLFRINPLETKTLKVRFRTILPTILKPITCKINNGDPFSIQL